MKRLAPLLAIFLASLVSSPAAVVPGHIEAWGNNFSGESIPPRFNDVIAIAAGLSHGLALRSNGTVVAWGRNAEGQTDVPPGLTNVIAISARLHSVALKADGTVVSWGYPNPVVTNVPPGLSNVVQISAGGGGNGNAHTLALRSDGTVVDFGLLQEGTTPPPGLRDLVQIAAGSVHAIALKKDGTVVAWGSPNPGSPEIVPPGLSNIVAARAGQMSSIVLRSDGTLFKWGSSFDMDDIPDGVTGVKDFSIGAQHVIALRTNGTVLAWGYNAQGQGSVPFGLNGISAVSAGANYNLVLTARPLINSMTPPAVANVGAVITLQVDAFGEPLAYQWYHHGAPIPGETKSSLVLNPIQPAQGGQYAVLISNPSGYTIGNTSISFPPPAITAQPQGLNAYRGENVAFSVTATGLPPFTYRWFKNSVEIPGATNSTYSLTAVDLADSASYDVVIQDITGATTTSAPAELSVVDPRAQTFIDLKPALDASIFSSLNNPQGQATILSGTRENGILDRGLLRFDLTTLPTNAVIDNAVLKLTILRGPRRSPAASSFRIHRILKPWTSSVTWTKANGAAGWSTPGAAPGVDYAAAGTTGTDSGTRFTATGAMLTDLRDWLTNPQTNFGWMLISALESAGGSARHFGSRKSDSPPILTLGYAIPAPPPVIIGTGVESTNLIFQIAGRPGWLYRIQTREKIESGDWIDLTNAPAGAALTPIIIRASLTHAHQFFRAIQN